jgi:hypothetical protein
MVESKPEKFLTENTKAGFVWLGLFYALSGRNVSGKIRFLMSKSVSQS